MNRKVGTSDSSQADGTHREAEGAAAKGGSRTDAARGGQDARDAKGSEAGRSAGGGPGDVGQLLRGAYRQTVDEAIPDDLMDLLNKLE